MRTIWLWCAGRNTTDSCLARARFLVGGVPACEVHLPQLISRVFGLLNGDA